MKWEGGCESRMGATFQSSIVRQGPSTCIASLCVNVKKRTGERWRRKPKTRNANTKALRGNSCFFSKIMMGTFGSVCFF